MLVHTNTRVRECTHYAPLVVCLRVCAQVFGVDLQTSNPAEALELEPARPGRLVLCLCLGVFVGVYMCACVHACINL
jgi:hypothetical protein